jgi:DNA polymerase-3 subunit epsilon
VRLRRAREGAAARFQAAPRPSASTPWREAAWCVIDLELTGLDRRRDEIIAIGAIPIEGGLALLGESLYVLARPSRPPQHDAVLVHKLRSPDLADAPPLDDAIELVLDALAGRVPVFHTSMVERLFLGRELRRRHLRLPADADTEALGRLWLRERDGETPAGLRLARLAELLGHPAEPAHHALGDALTTAKAFLSLASILDAAGPQTVGSLVGAETRLAGARRLAPG